MGRDALGELEYRVLVTLLRLREDAYSAAIMKELHKRTKRPLKTATVYIALRRLEEKSFVDSAMRPPGPQGGRHRRHFSLTEEGRLRVRAEYAGHLRLVEGLEELLGESG